MPTVLLTGFPGFLGARLAVRLLRRLPPTTTLTCLVQPKFMTLAQARAAELAADGRVTLVPGDITAPDLGLGAAYPILQADTVEVYHLAAVYDLSVRGDVAARVNVDGTRHVLDFAAGCPNLTRLHYVSTCYVSGRHAGVFTEDDLELGQPFYNHYEATKHAAEVLVRARMTAGLPTTIYRPAITVGDSTTGETQKYDGLYTVIGWLQRQLPGFAPLPVVGDTRRHLVNVVPQDYVLSALDALAAQTGTVGGTFALADPAPKTVDQMITLLGVLLDRRIVRVPLPGELTKAALRLAPVGRFVRIPPEALDYFSHPARYTTHNTTRALTGTGIACPPFEQVAPALIRYLRAHPHLSATAMA